MVSTFIGLLDIQSWWEIPCIAHFCSLFSSAFNLPDIDIEDFELALLIDGKDDKDDLIALLPKLIVQLLIGCYKKNKNDITTSSYQMFLRRFFRFKCRQHNIENYFDTDTDFQSLPVRKKLLILHSLCHFRLESDDVIRKFNNLEADSLRVEPLGYDSNNSGYWYFFGTRLYREDYINNNIDNNNENTVWQVICFTEEDWQNLAAKFKNSTNTNERALLDILVENFLPKLPHLFREKEKLRRKKLFQARNSARLLKQKELREHQQIIEQERHLLEAHTSKRRRSQSTSTASGISTYASSIRPSINSSDFLYKREKFCLSPDLCGGSISTTTPLPNINQQLFPPTPSQSPIAELSQKSHKTITDCSDNNEDYETEQEYNNNNNCIKLNNDSLIGENNININDKHKSTNDYQEILKQNNFIDNQKKYNITNNNKENLSIFSTTINDNSSIIYTPEEIENNKLSAISLKYDNDTISVSSIGDEEEDKENFIFYKRSNTSDTTTTITEDSCSSSGNISFIDRDIVDNNILIKKNNKNIKKKKLNLTSGENIMAPTTNMKLPGRQTNNSLSSLSGNIFIPPLEANKVTKTDIGKTSAKRDKSSNIPTSSTETMAGGSSSNQNGSNSGNKKKKSKSNEIAAVVIKKSSTLSTVALNNNCFSMQQNQQTQNPFLSFTETDEVLQIGMHKVLVHVKNHRDAWPFVDPVEEDIAPRYYSIIRRPMDLLKMEDKLDNGEYKKFSEFRNDFKLIVNNCRLYNGQNNEYTEMVNNLQDAFDKATKKYFDHYSDEDDETNLGYLDTKLNVFREKHYNKTSTTVVPQPENDNDNDDDDIDTSTTKVQKIKDKYKENTLEKHHHKLNEKINDDDDDNEYEINDEVQNDFKINKRKRKDKDKRRKKKLKLESITNDNNENEDLHQNELITSNDSYKNRFEDDEPSNEDVNLKIKNKKSKKILETNVIKKSSSSSVNKKVSKKKTETKTKEIKSKLIETKSKDYKKIDDAINKDDDIDNINKLPEKKLNKKLKTKNTSKNTKSSKLKTTNRDYSDNDKDDIRDQTVDYNSDNSFNSNKNPNLKYQSSTNSLSVFPSSQIAVDNSKLKKNEKENLHILQNIKSKKGNNNNNSSAIKDSKKLSNTQEEIVAVPHNKKRKTSNKNNELNSKSKGLNKNHENSNKKNCNEDEFNEKAHDSNKSDSDNDSLMSLSSTRSRIFKVDLHKKYANSASLDDNVNFVLNEKLNNSYKKSTTSSKLNNKLLKPNNYNSNDDNDNNSIISNRSLTNRSSTPINEQSKSNSKILSSPTRIQGKQTVNKSPSKKKSKSIKNKIKSIKNNNIQNQNDTTTSNNVLSSLLPVNSSISSSNSSLNNKETEIHHEKSINNINGPELETSSSHSLFLDKYDLIKQRRSRNNNSATTTEEKWNQIVKEAAEKNKDNKKNFTTSTNKISSGGTNTSSNKDKNQKLKETIAKLKAKNEKSKERSVLIDEIFGVKPTQEIRDEKTIFEKLRETCLDSTNNKTSLKSLNNNKQSNTEISKPKSIKSQKKSELKEKISNKITKKKITKQSDKKSQPRKQTTPNLNAPITKKKSQLNNKTNMEALELETEQTLKDINRWLEHTPRFSEFSSASNSPSRYNLLDDFDAVAAKLDPNDFRRPVAQIVAATATTTDTLIATISPKKTTNNESRLAETFEENSSAVVAGKGAGVATNSSKSPICDQSKVPTEPLPSSNILNKNITSAKEEISQSSSNATINSSSNQSSISSTMPLTINAPFTTGKTTKEPSVTQLLPHPPPPPPHIKTQIQKEVKRKTLKEKITGQSHVRRKDTVRTMDRFQPGKSKGNLLSNTNHSKTGGTNNNGNDEIFPLNSSVVSKLKEVKNSLVVKTDESAPKLSLGSVLDTEGFGLGQLHNFGDELSCGELKISDAITSGDENDDKKKIDNLTVSSSSPSDCGSKDTIMLSDDKVKSDDVKDTQGSSKNENESETAKGEIKSEIKTTTSATPNLSAWFKAFGAPKKTKKQEDEEANAAAAKKSENLEAISASENVKLSTSTEHGNSSTFNTLKSPVQSLNENFSLPAPRQRKASTGSTISERSSFSQDPDSPRIGIDDRFGAYPGPYASPIGASPIGASPIMVSPKPDEIVKPTSPYPLNGAIKVGFYQDTTTKSSPEKSCSPRELPSPAYPQYSQHIYTSTTSPNITTDLTTTSNTTPITTSPYSAGGNSNGSTNTGCYNPSVDPNKTPTGSSTIYSPTSPVTPATPNLYEQYKQPHSQESDYNSSMSPSTNPNSPYQQPQSSPYQHNPNSPYQQSSNQNSPYQQPNSPYQSQQPTQVQSQNTVQPSTPSSNNSNNSNNSNTNNQNSMPIAIHSPGNTGGSQPIVPLQQTAQQNEIPLNETSSYQQQSNNSSYQQQSLQSPYQKNQTASYQSIPTAHQSVPVLSSQQQQQQQTQIPMNFGQQQTIDTSQQHQQIQQHDQQKQQSPSERQQYPTDAQQSRYSNLLENSTQYQHQPQQQTVNPIRSAYEQQQQTSNAADQWKSSQNVVQAQNSQAINLQQHQNPINSMNLPMNNNMSGMGSVVDQQQQQQIHTMNQLQQQSVKSSSSMQYPNYTQYSAPSEKDNNMHKTQVYGSELSNQMMHKQNPANILNPLHMQQPLHQQHPPKRSHSNDTTSGTTASSALMNLGYSEPNQSMSDPKIQKRTNEQQQIDKMFDNTNNNTSTLNKHQQMFDSFLGSMGKNLGFGKSLDIPASKAYEMFNKATTAMNFHNKDFTTNQNRLQQPSIKDINIDNNSVGNNNNNNLQQHNMSNVNQGKTIDHNSANNASYQQQHSQQQHSQNQQQVPSNIFNTNNNNGSASTGKHPQQNHPSNYSQHQNTNEKSHLIIPNPRQDQMSNIGRNMELSTYKTTTFNNPSAGLLDPLRNINHAMAMMDDSMLGLQNSSSLSGGSGSGGGYYDKSMPPAAHMFSKNLPQQIYQNPGHYGMGRDQQNPPPPGNYVPSSNSGVANMSTSALQMEQQQQQIVEIKPKRGKKKKVVTPMSNEIQNNQIQNSMLSNSQLQQQQQLQQHQHLQQQQQQQQMSSHVGSVSNSNNNNQNMLSSNQSSVQVAATAAHHQGFQLYAGLKNAAAVAAASTSSSAPVGSSGIQTNSTDVSAISLKTASAAAAASMVSGSAFNFGPSAAGLGIPTGIYDNSGYLDDFRSAPNPYYMPPSHRVTPDPTGGTVNSSSTGLGLDKSINSNNTNPNGPTAVATAAAAAAAANPYHQFLSHQAATQRSSYPFMNSPQLDPNSPLYTQYMRPTTEELRARMIHGLLPGAPSGYTQTGYRPPPTHLGMPKPYDMNRNPWF